MTHSDWLLLKACRRLLWGLLAGILVMLGVGGSLLLYSLLGAELENERDYRNSAVIAGIAIAALAAFAFEMSGLRDRLASLPVPVTTRQLTYLPLLLMLSVVGAGFVLYGVVMLIAWLAGTGVIWSGAAIGMVHAFPYIVFIISFAHWITCGLGQTQSFYAYLFLPMLVTSEMADNLEANSPLLASIMLAVSGAALWDAPRRVDTWYRAQFTTIPSFWWWVRLRESGVPYRMNASSTVADILLRFLYAAIIVPVLVLYFWVVFSSLDGDRKAPTLAVQAFWYGLYAYLLLVLLGVAARAIHLRIQSGQLPSESLAAQVVLKGVWRYFSIVNASQSGGSPVYRCGRCGNCRPAWADCCEAQRKIAARSIEASAHTIRKRLLSMPFLMVICCGLMLPKPFTRVAELPEGSRILGDPTSLALGKGTDFDHAPYSQHYIAVRFLDEDAEAVPATINKLRGIIETQPDPSDWIVGLQARAIALKTDLRFSARCEVLKPLT